MTLKELQNMIKEEFNAYKFEAEDEVDVSVSDADVDAEMGDEMGDEMAPEGEEDVLRQIYDLLAAHFEGEEGEGEEDLEDLEAPEDIEGEEAPEADIEENATTNAKYQKTGFAAGGGKSTKDSGYVKPGGKGSTGYDVGSKALQERFQKLANIIK